MWCSVTAKKHNNKTKKKISQYLQFHRKVYCNVIYHNIRIWSSYCQTLHRKFRAWHYYSSPNTDHVLVVENKHFCAGLRFISFLPPHRWPGMTVLEKSCRETEMSGRSFCSGRCCRETNKTCKPHKRFKYQYCDIL